MMAGFKALKEVGINFDEELKRMNDELFSAKPLQNSEDVLAKKLDDLKLFSSKYHLLHAKELADTPLVAERIRNQANILEDYTNTAQNRIIERAVVKSLTQSRALQGFLTTPDRKLEPEMVERKRKILSALEEFRTQESTHRQLTTVLQEKQEEYHEVRSRWDAVLAAVAAERATAKEVEEEESPLYSKLQSWSVKMEMIRWLLGRLVVARAPQYDWLGDPARRVSALALTRRRCDVAALLADDDDS